MFWLATRLDRMGVWSQAGPVARIQGGNIWWAAVPEEDRPQDEAFAQNLARIWDAEVGDCRQELVLIGVGLDSEKLTMQLSQCLLTDRELAEGAMAWQVTMILCPNGNSLRNCDFDVRSCRIVTRFLCNRDIR